MKSISYEIKHVLNHRWAKVALVAALLITPAVLTGCGKRTANTGNQVSVGLVGSDDEKIWKPIAKRLKKQGVHLKIVDFSDYTQPNQALQHQETDVNSFQTYQFLDNYNHVHHSHILPDGKTIVEPLGLYSKKVHSLNQLKKGSTVTLPNDSSNEARALNLLKSAHLLKLKKVALPSTKDVIDNKKDLKLKPVSAAQTARTLNDADASVINSNFALDAKLNPKRAIFREKLNRKLNPFINIIAATKSEKKRKAVKKVVRAYQSKSTYKRLEKVFKGTEVPAWDLKLK